MSSVFKVGDRVHGTHTFATYIVRDVEKGRLLLSLHGRSTWRPQSWIFTKCPGDASCPSCRQYALQNARKHRSR
jgi:hypothetical protein